MDAKNFSSGASVRPISPVIHHKPAELFGCYHTERKICLAKSYSYAKEIK